jgi:2-dehydro-3-deoxy-D-gluconate 5-dehydrogenase
MIPDLFTLTGRVAVVTGSSKGLGQAIAVALAEAGADIAAFDRSDSAETGALITGLGRRFLKIPCDLSNATVKDFEQNIAQVVTEFGRVDILVNNAGTIRRANVLEFSEADWDDVIQVNLKSVFFLSQATAKRMVQQPDGGKIINIASLLSFQGGIRVPSYTAAKSGMAGLTRTMANELASRNVNVNAIAPGYMVTDNTAALRADESRYQSILERIPAGRWGLPDDLKGVAVFLASDAARYVHGAVIPVDGGWLAR